MNHNQENNSNTIINRSRLQKYELKILKVTVPLINDKQYYCQSTNLIFSFVDYIGKECVVRLITFFEDNILKKDNDLEGTPPTFEPLGFFILVTSLFLLHLNGDIVVQISMNRSSNILIPLMQSCVFEIHYRILPLKRSQIPHVIHLIN